MTVIYNDGNVNAPSVTTPDAYIRIIPPPGYIKGVKTDVVGIIGTASWGPMNEALLCGMPADVRSKFGGNCQYSAVDPFDVCVEAEIAFMQADSPASFEAQIVRIEDGTAAAATYTLKDTTSGTAKDGLVLTAKNKGKKGEEIKIRLEDGAKTNTYNLHLIPFDGGPYESFLNLLHGGNGEFWANALAAINLGQGVQRPPSELVVASSPDATAIAPAKGTFALTGGADGRTDVDKNDFIGSDASYPGTGIYAFRALNPLPTLIWCAGLIDNTAFTTIQALCLSEAFCCLLPFNKGTSTATALSTKKTLGIDDPNCIFVKDWIYWNDPVARQVRLVPPTAFIGGRIAALEPQNSPLNKQVYGVVGTERIFGNNNRPYSHAEIGQLNQGGITFITNPVPGGNYWGIRTAKNSSSDEVRSFIEYARMTNYLAHSLQTYVGKFVGLNQSVDRDDPVRQAVKATLDSYLSELQDARQIDSFDVQCDHLNNPPDQVAKHILKAQIKVRYMSSIQYFFIDLQGGTTVVTIESQRAA